MGIRAVFFDMGGTLEGVSYTIEQRKQSIPGLVEVFHSHGMDLHMPVGQLYEMVAAGYKRYHRWSMDTMIELPTFRAWDEYILPGLPVDKEKLAGAAEELMVYLEDHFFQREMRPETPAVLEEVRRMGLSIGLISNVCSLGLVPRKLEEYGIRNYFDPLILSSEYGRRKPDPAIFHYAARLAKVPTSACAHVGDRIARDIMGARKAGYGLALQIINAFDHGENDEGAEPDNVINDLWGVVDHLKDPGIFSIPNARQKGIRALLFDAGDILYYRPDRGKYLKAFLLENGLDGKDIPTALQDALKQRVYHGEISQEEYRESFLRLYGIDEPALLERGKQAMDLDDNNIAFFEGVPETLRKLKEAGFMLAIITDTAMPLHVKLGWFERGGFGDVWDAYISSVDLGVQKPASRIYHAALAQLGIGVEQAVFVGHHPEELDGACSIGMRTIAFNYEEGTKADFYVENFCDLLKVPVLSQEEPVK